MGKTSIEWTGRTWNPVRGCTRVSEGCRNCYAERQAVRMSGPGQAYEGLVRSTPSGPRWTGKVRLVPEHLHDPLAWQKPGMVFVNSMSDLFHDGLSNEDIAAVVGVILASEKQTHQVLTKRAERLPEWFCWLKDVAQRCSWSWSTVLLSMAAGALEAAGQVVWATHLLELSRHSFAWPIKNLWLGVSVEDQEAANERIPHLLDTPAAVRFVSYEPALGPINFNAIRIPDETRPLHFSALQRQHDDCYGSSDTTLDWVIAGAESGHGARPMKEEWVRAARDQCAMAEVSFFYKQAVEGRKKISLPMLDGVQHAEFPA